MSSEQFANGVRLKSESRPSARVTFASIAHLIQPGDPFEDFDDVLPRVRQVHDLAMFDDL
ncbi:hypothetical protein GCM10011491_44180 [Brucella endophytica]|uniref:Uncharacterized protein n=1 Tax=Brucella endophytica TaxID=1963359 RepID=A0A916SSI8_9HYPH|nr:hypothetical protein GCM10011491_44180 [Brucella endophytica]